MINNNIVIREIKPGDNAQIEKIIKSTMHIVMSEQVTLAPKRIGSGCIINYNGNEVLLTVAHVTNVEAGTCILAGRDSEMYSVGAMTYLNRFNLDKYDEQLEQLKKDMKKEKRP